MKRPDASAASRSTASSHARSSAPRRAPCPHCASQAANTLARPAAPTRYAKGRSHIGRLCIGSAASPLAWAGGGSRAP
eukprot:9441537-Lingulodinium_polyedra.AAC.1